MTGFVPLHTLEPGTLFQVGEDDEDGKARRGVLLKASSFGCRVRYKDVPPGQDYPVNVAANVLVRPLEGPGAKPVA